VRTTLGLPRLKSSKSGTDAEQATKPSASSSTPTSTPPLAARAGKEGKATKDDSAQKGSESKSSDGDQQQNSLLDYFHLPNLPPLPNIPHLPHRPTKEEFLAAANGFFERLRVRFKWYSIRSMRPWNSDEWGAFLSFFVFGHIVWILLGTTTFVSLVILSINTVVAQGIFP
jgi:mitochondrial distribution and morphology protein 31